MTRTSNASDATDGASIDSDWGVMLIAHGSQRGTDRTECSCAWEQTGSQAPSWCLECPSTPEGLKHAAGRLQLLLGLSEHQIVLSCLEFIEPFPKQAISPLKERGFQRVALVPFLLGSGKHATLEMEEVLQEVQEVVPGVSLHLAEGLGTDPLLAELVVQRVQGLSALKAFQPVNGHTSGVVLVKAGTKTIYDDCVWLRELGKLVENRLGPGYAVSVAQSHYGDPTMEEATEILVKEREASSLMYVPYLFFPGIILKRNVLGGMVSLQKKYPHLPMAATPPLGADERVVAVAAERVRGVWAREPSNEA